MAAAAIVVCDAVSEPHGRNSACSRACILLLWPSTFLYQHLVETAAYPDPKPPVLTTHLRLCWSLHTSVAGFTAPEAAFMLQGTD